MIGRVAWCTALFGAYQIGVKFVKVDDDRGALPGHVRRLPGRHAGARRRCSGRRGPRRARGPRRSLRLPDPMPPARAAKSQPPRRQHQRRRPAHVRRGPHAAIGVHGDDPRPVRGRRRPELPIVRSRKAKRSRSACSWCSTTSRPTRRRCGSRGASRGPQRRPAATPPASASRSSPTSSGPGCGNVLARDRRAARPERLDQRRGERCGRRRGRRRARR